MITMLNMLLPCGVPRMPSGAANSNKTSFDTSSNTFSRSRNIVVQRDLYPLQKAVIGASVCINVAIASIVSTPLLKHREYLLIDWAYHLTMASPNRSMTSENSEK